MDATLDNIIPKTLWQKIYLHLLKLNYLVYSPGQKRDKCQDPYVVIKDTGTYGQEGNNKVGYKLFDIIIYYPLQSYSSMESYIENIKEELKQIKEIRYTGNETPCVIDDEVKAYTSSIEYQGVKTLRRDL